ncbi:MAG: hypothetical protein IBX52_04785 [Bacterioplanes sp.]|nr:hypothetical protein [Bacterioplanes sp.]
MRVIANRSWTILPSKRQRHLDGMTALLLFLLLAFMGSALWASAIAQIGWLVVVLLLVVGFWCWSRYPQQVGWVLHRDEQGWWCDVGDGAWRSVRLCSGSVKRPDLVIWQYGHWPWQRWLFRPDSFTSPAEFQQLRRILYPDL